MNKTKELGIIIQARISSTRLPRKIILKVDEKFTFLDLLLTKLKKLKKELPIIVATSIQEADNILEKFTNKHSLELYRGSESNVLQRFIDCAEKYHLKTIIRICSDNPFVDLKAIEKLIHNYNGEDYFSYKINNSPSILTHFGFFTEIVTLSALKKVARQENSECLEHVTNCIYKKQNVFNVGFLEENIENTNIRCTLDTKEDFEILKDIYYNYFKENLNSCYLDIIKYIETRPDLLVRMEKIIKENKK